MNMRPGKSGLRRLHCGGVALWLSAAALPAAAQVGPITSQALFFDQAQNAHVGNYLAAEAGMIYTDNAQLTPDGTGSGIGLIGLVGDLRHEGSRLDYQLDSDIAVARYTDGDYSTEVAGYLDGLADFKIVPGLFYWSARETYSQQELNPFLPPTPENLENINNLSTGPRLILRPTLRTTISLDAQYAYIYTTSPSSLYLNLNSSRYSGDLSLERAFSNAASAYVTGSVQRVLFNDTTTLVPTDTVIGIIEQPQTINDDYTLSQAVVGYRLTNTRTVLDLSGGATALRLNNETLHGGTWNLSLARVLTPSQRLTLRASQELTDAVGQLRQNLAQPVPSITAERLANGDPFTSRQYGIDWRFEGPRTSFELGALQYTDHYVENSTNDVTSKFVSALAARQLNPVLNWDIGIRYEHQSYQTGTINTTSEITNLRWQVGRKVELRFLYAHSNQNAHSNQSPIDYVDNQVGVIVSYALVGTREPLGATPALSPSMSPLSPLSTLPPLR
jgi:hypothetical protein